MSGIGTAAHKAAVILCGVLLFVLTAGYVFVSLALLSLGIVTFPSVMLGRLGFLTVTTDLSESVLVLGSAGVLLIGLGMSLCMFSVCTGALGIFTQMMKKAEIRGKRILDEENKTS